MGREPEVALQRAERLLHKTQLHIAALDGRERLLTRHTEPSRDVALLLEHLKLALPPQPPPKIRYPAAEPRVEM